MEDGIISAESSLANDESKNDEIIFWPLRGIQFWDHFGTHFGINFDAPEFWEFP